jgi:hypothetical protein
VPRYFFHFRDGSWTVDPDGQELTDVEAARLEAQRIARELAQGGEPATAAIVVMDGHQTLFEVSLSPSNEKSPGRTGL